MKTVLDPIHYRRSIGRACCHVNPYEIHRLSAIIYGLAVSRCSTYLANRLVGSLNCFRFEIIFLNGQLIVFRFWRSKINGINYVKVVSWKKDFLSELTLLACNAKTLATNLRRICRIGYHIYDTCAIDIMMDPWQKKSMNSKPMV